MTVTKLKSSVLASVAALTLSSPNAGAQSSETAAAIANILQAESTLTVTSETGLTFGDIYRPAATPNNNRCRYRLWASLDGNQRPSAEEINSFDLGSTGINTSGCAFGPALPNLARFDVACSAATPTNISINWQDAGATGLTFRQPTQNSVSVAPAVAFSNAAPNGTNNSANRLAVSSASGAMVVDCPAAGDYFVNVGGEVIVDLSASIQQTQQVGTIVLNATY